MDTRTTRAAKRIIAALLLAAGLGGCAVYAPPYAAYEPYHSRYAYPTYVAPPVFLDFGFYEHRHYGKYHGKHYGKYHGKHHGKYHGGHHGHGWRGHGGWGHGRGWGAGHSWGHRRGGRH